MSVRETIDNPLSRPLTAIKRYSNPWTESWQNPSRGNADGRPSRRFISWTIHRSLKRLSCADRQSHLQTMKAAASLRVSDAGRTSVRCDPNHRGRTRASPMEYREPHWGCTNPLTHAAGRAHHALGYFLTSHGKSKRRQVANGDHLSRMMREYTDEKSFVMSIRENAFKRF
jgi:hypothetical protein